MKGATRQMALAKRKKSESKSYAGIIKKKGGWSGYLARKKSPGKGGTLPEEETVTSTKLTKSPGKGGTLKKSATVTSRKLPVEGPNMTKAKSKLAASRRDPMSGGSKKSAKKKRSKKLTKEQSKEMGYSRDSFIKPARKRVLGGKRK